MVDKKKAAKRQRAVVSAQSMVDHAPVAGNKTPYITLPKGVKMFKPVRDKTYRLIFVPWIAGKGNETAAAGSYATNRYLFVHKQLGPNDESHICPAKTWKKACAVCSRFQQERSKIRFGDKNAWEAIRTMQPKDREIFLIHDLDGDKNNLQIWEESIHLFGNFLREKIARKTNRMTYADFEKGMIIEVVGTAKKMGDRGECVEFKSVEFEKREDSDGNPLDLEAIYDLAEKICLDDCVKETSNEVLKKLIGEMKDNTEDPDDNEDDDSDSSDTDDDEDEPEEPSDTEEDGEEEDEVPVKPRSSKTTPVKDSKPKRGKKPEPEDEDEPEDESDDTDDDSDDSDEDDLDNEDDLEEEDEPPPPKKRGKK